VGLRSFRPAGSLRTPWATPLGDSTRVVPGSFQGQRILARRQIRPSRSEEGIALFEVTASGGVSFWTHQGFCVDSDTSRNRIPAVCRELASHRVPAAPSFSFQLGKLLANGLRDTHTASRFGVPDIHRSSGHLVGGSSPWEARTP
jgi:hypothetical protein